LQPFLFWLFRVFCEKPFTTEAKRGEAATESRIISRKDAKAAKKKNGSGLGVLGALAREMSESEMFRILEDLPKPRKFSSIVAPSSQRSENFFHQELFTPRPPRLSGAISESCLDRKAWRPFILGDPSVPKLERIW
jgi:hypothetical protein